MTGLDVQVRRIYDEAPAGPGYRVLVDRLWPRGVSKETARLDEWCKAVAPSADLRKWYGHQPERFGEFRRRYLAELGDEEHADAACHLAEQARRGTLLLLTATKDLDRSGAAVLGEHLRQLE